MNLDCVEKIAEAVLYEGYMLYPYRASAVKNQQRWNFGVLCPRSYSEQKNGSDAWMMQTECLVQANPSTRLNTEIRFLQIVNRSIGKLTHPLLELPSAGEPEFELVDKLIAAARLMDPIYDRQVWAGNPALREKLAKEAGRKAWLKDGLARTFSDSVGV